jgi:ABC-type multidrug transport system fused ATPase/permease subunit
MPPTFLGLQELFIIIVIIAVTLFALIAAGVLYLRRIKPQAVALEAIKIQELISLVISILYFFTVCVTLILLIVQNRNIAIQTQFALQSLEGNVYGQVMSQTLAQDELFIKNPETRPYFYESKELHPDDPLSYKVLATAEYLLDFYDSLEKQLKHYPHLWIHEQKTWEANIIDMFAYSPVLCRYLDTTKEWYSDSLYALKTEGEKKRRQGFNKQKISKD